MKYVFHMLASFIYENVIYDFTDGTETVSYMKNNFMHT